MKGRGSEEGGGWCGHVFEFASVLGVWGVGDVILGLLFVWALVSDQHH